MNEDCYSATMLSVFEGHDEVNKAWKWAKAFMQKNPGPLGLDIYVIKSRDQEKLYHSCFRDLARDCLYAGEKVDAETWKRGLLQAFYDATKDDPDYANDWKSRAPRLIPALDGDEMLMISIESKRFTKKLATAFITFVHSVGDQRGVKWSRTSLGRDVPDEVTA